jgi:protein regulator of cytokinesis 1
MVCLLIPHNLKSTLLLLSIAIFYLFDLNLVSSLFSVQNIYSLWLFSYPCMYFDSLDYIFPLCSVCYFIENHTLLQLQDLGSTLIELWNLMDTPIDEQRSFDHVTSLIKVSPNTVMPPGCLAHELIEKVIVLLFPPFESC